MLADNGCIYCAPLRAKRILKIDTVNGNVTTLDAVLPAWGVMKWASGALALDGNIYFIPFAATRVGVYLN